MINTDINWQEKLDELKTAATKHRNIIAQGGSYKIANREHDKIIELLHFFYQNDNMDKLVPLLDDPEVGVRLWIATYLLPIHEESALEVLRDCNIFESEVTISEWEKGNLKLSLVYRDKYSE